MQLINLIENNKYLCFIDASNGRKYSLDDLKISWVEQELQGRGLIFLYLENSVEATAIYLSLLNTEYTLVLLSNSLGIGLKDKLEAEYEPYLIYDKEREGVEGYTPFSINAKAFSPRIYRKKVGSSGGNIHENIKVLLSTSGTTGSPKFVKLSENNLRENALSIADYLPITHEDVTPLNLPLHYSYGLSILHSNAIAGGTILCNLPDVLQKDFWKYFDEYRANSIAGVPYVYEMLKRIGFLKKQHPSLKYLTQAGGNLNAAVKIEFLDYCNKNNIDFFVMYGQTEATARISFVPPTDLKDKIKSIGKPIKNGSLFLDPETDELQYKGPNIYGGYASRKEDLKDWDKIEILKTGDIASCDKDGFYFIKGRLKRFVKIFGNRINLDELEVFCKPFAPNGILACTGVNDEIILIAHGDAELDETKLKSQLNQQFKIHPSTIRFYIMEEIPLTSNGKVNYKAISENYINNIL